MPTSHFLFGVSRGVAAAKLSGPVALAGAVAGVARVGAGGPVSLAAAAAGAAATMGLQLFTGQLVQPAGVASGFVSDAKGLEVFRESSGTYQLEDPVESPAELNSGFVRPVTVLADAVAPEVVPVVRSLHAVYWGVPNE